MPESESGTEAVARSDRLLDALAAGARMSPTDPVASMLAGWRDDVRRTPDTQVLSLAEAMEALAEGKRAGPHHRFAITVTGAVAAALLCVGGFGAVIYGAGPGDPLYGLHSALFGSAQTTRGDQVALAAQTELEQVQQLVQQGQWQQAQDKLAAVSTTVQDVSDSQRKQELIDQWNDLTVKVVQRDPSATLTPGAPPPVLPGMSAPLSPGPAVAPGSTSASPTPSSPSSPSASSPTPTTTSGSETPTATGTPATTPTSAPPPAPATTGTSAASSTSTTVPSPAATTTSTPVAAPPAPAPTPATTTDTATTTTTASPSPSTVTTTATTVTSAPQETSTAGTSSQQQAPGPVQQQTLQQQTSDAAVPTDAPHGEANGSAPGPRANAPEAQLSTAEPGAAN